MRRSLEKFAAAKLFSCAPKVQRCVMISWRYRGSGGHQTHDARKAHWLRIIFPMQHPINWGLLPSSKTSETWLFPVIGPRCGKRPPPSGSWRGRSKKCLARPLTTRIQKGRTGRTGGVGSVALAIYGSDRISQGSIVVFALQSLRRHLIEPGGILQCFLREVCLETMVKCGKERRWSTCPNFILQREFLSLRNRVSFVCIGASKKYMRFSFSTRFIKFYQYFTLQLVGSKICLPAFRFWFCSVKCVQCVGWFPDGTWMVLVGAVGPSPKLWLDTSCSTADWFETFCSRKLHKVLVGVRRSLQEGMHAELVFIWFHMFLYYV